jgi:hypothetical protein
MEMNMHFPQSIQTMGELKDLASIPFMIISPKSGKPIIEVVQDILVGSYRITNDRVNLPEKVVANLQMVNSYFDTSLNNKESFTGKEIFSKILPPSFFINNKKLEIVDSIIKSGQLDKKSFQSITNGLIPVIYHDYGPYEAKRFLDNTQRLICRWLMLDGFSVGISDLVMQSQTNQEIKQKIKELKQKAYEDLGEFRKGNINNDSISNNENFVEAKIINTLNDINKQVSKICLDNIRDESNRMINMIRSGSKGKENNVAQMIGCVGQQNFDGKRISYGFTERTLPHFTKYDDGPDARGFVENSFIHGLTPQEVFFHAMGGREGLIDTAVKSVTWDTPIIIIENNESKYVKIGEWIDGYLDDKNNKDLIEVFPNDMNMELLKLKDKIIIPTTNDNGVVTWESVTNITRHDPGDILYEIKTLGGRDVIVTASKGLIIWKDNKFIETKTSEIKIGDYLPVTMNLEEPPIISEYIDMEKYFSKEEYIYGNDFIKVKKIMDNNKKLPSNWWIGNNDFTLPYPNQKAFRRTLNNNSEKNKNIKEGYLYSYHSTKITYHIPDKFELNETNGIFIGLFLADGNARIKPAQVCITKNEESIQEFIKIWFKKYNINYMIDDRENKGTSIIGSSSILAEFLIKLLGHKAQNKHIPDISYTAHENFIKGIINGYFSGDGSIDLSTNTIIAVSISKRLIEDISLLLTRFGIFSKIKLLKDKSYKLTIRAQWAKKFKDTFELVHKIKNNKLKEMKINDYKHYNFKEQNDVILDRIIEINEIPNNIVKTKYPKMYDITVPSTLNFMISNGMQVRDTSDTG